MSIRLPRKVAGFGSCCEEKVIQSSRKRCLEALSLAISTARNALAGIDGTLDPAMVVNRAVL